MLLRQEQKAILIMNDSETTETFNEQALLKDLSLEQVETLKKTFIEQEFEPNDVIIEEGDLTQDIYLLIEGEVGVLKWDDEHFNQTLLGKIAKGEMFGEMSFLDASPRSSTIKAFKKTKVIKIAHDEASLDPEIFSKMIANIAKANINRLRSINRQFVKNLEKKDKQTKVKENVEEVLLFEYLILGFSVFLAWNFAHPQQMFLPWLIALIPSFLLVKIFGFPLSNLGITKNNFFKTALQAVFFVFIVLGLIYLLEQYALTSANPILLKYFSLKPELIPFSWTWGTMALYVFSQEFIARGILQNSLRTLLKNKKSTYFILLNGCFLFLFFSTPRN